jgi:hypothetical protein
MRRALAALALACAGCVNAPDYQSSVGWDGAEPAEAWRDAAVAGAGGCGAAAERLASHLASEAGLPDVSATLSADDLELLTSDPLGFGLGAAPRAALRERIGRSRLLVLECVDARVLQYGQWDVLVVVPPPVLLILPIPVIHGLTWNVRHAGVAVRFVDLEAGRIEAESFQLLRHGVALEPAHVSSALRELREAAP